MIKILPNWEKFHSILVPDIVVVFVVVELVAADAIWGAELP